MIGILAAAQTLVMMEDCWPKQGNLQWVLMILLLLAALQAAKGEQSAIRGDLILWWLTAFLLGSVLLSAVSELQSRHWAAWRNERKWEKMLELLTVLLLPCLIGREKKSMKSQWSLLLLPVACSFAVQGALVQTGSEEDTAAFYELSRYVRLYGIVERMEAMAWLGLMLGTYLYMTFLLTIAAGKEEQEKNRNLMIVICAAAAEMISVILGEEILAVLLLAAIIAIELLLACLKETKKRKKRKERKMGKYENSG